MKRLTMTLASAALAIGVPLAAMAHDGHPGRDHAYGHYKAQPYSYYKPQPYYPPAPVVYYRPAPPPVLGYPGYAPAPIPVPAPVVAPFPPNQVSVGFRFFF